MAALTVELLNKSCAFVMQITDPVETLKRLAAFFQERRIGIDTMHLHRYRDGDAMLIIHCKVEKDRIYRTVELLEKMPGVLSLERMEGR